MARFSFTDLHSFKDYVGFVKICATNNSFSLREDFAPNVPWTLELAFEGLRLGLKMAVEEKGPKPVFAACEKLVDEAYAHYKEGRVREGFFKLEEMQKLLKKVPSW